MGHKHNIWVSIFCIFCIIAIISVLMCTGHFCGVRSRKMIGIILFHHLNIRMILTANTILHFHTYCLQLITYGLVKLLKFHRRLRMRVLCRKATGGLRRNTHIEFQKMEEGCFVEEEVQNWFVEAGSPLFQQSGIQEVGSIQGL